MFASTQKNIIQPKLTIGQPNDKYEQEADAVADQVMRMPASEIPPVQRKCDKCEEEEEELQMKPQERSISTIQQKSKGENKQMQGLQSSLQQSKGGGETLEDSTNQLMSRGIGADFSNVKIHTDSNAIQMNQQLNAKAFTNGSDIYFNQGQYNTQSSEGKHLLAHELTHVVQQGSVSTFQTTPDIQKHDSDCTSRQDGPILIFGGIPPGLDCDLEDVDNDEAFNCCSSELQAAVPRYYQTAKEKTDRAIELLDSNANVDSAIIENFGSHALWSRSSILTNLRTIRAELNNADSHTIICRAKPCPYPEYRTIRQENPHLFCRNNVEGSYTPGTRRITFCTNIDGRVGSNAWGLLLHEIVHLAGIGNLLNRIDPALTAEQRAAGEYEVYRGEDNYANVFSLRNADSYSEFVKDVSSSSYAEDSNAILAAPNITLGVVSALTQFRPGMIGRLTWSPLGGNTQFIVGLNGVWFPPSDDFDVPELSGLRAYTGGELGLAHIFGGDIGGHIELGAGAGTFIRQDGEIDLGISARLSGGVRFGGPEAGFSINADVQRILQINDGAVVGGLEANWYGGISFSGRWGTSGRPR